MSGVLTTTILSDGNKMSKKYNLISVDIIKEVNKIPVAQIILLDGDAAKQEFAVSDTDFFKPGKEIEIKFRHEKNVRDEATVFQGIVVKHGIQADRFRSLLTVDLKDAAIKLTTQRKSVVFRDSTDKDIIEKIIAGVDLKVGKVASTKPKHQEMVQFYCTDWDFMLTRTDANGCWVLAQDGEISIIQPSLQGSAKHSFEYGISEIYELSMEADISHQYESVESQVWDIKKQELTPVQQAKDFSLAQGNLKASELAKEIGAEKLQLINSVQLDDQESQAWADAKMIKSRLSMLKGRLKVPGSADIKLGDIIEVAGTGKRFNGKTLVTGIRHQVGKKSWQTDIQFGLSANWFSQNNDIVDTPASGLVPAINGLHVGIVDEYEDDPDQQFRVKVKIPSIKEEEEDGSVWARLTTVDAGNRRGTFFRPEPGDEVILGFINDDPRQAIILGAMHSEKNDLPPGLEVTEDNNKKGIVTKESLRILFDDEKKSIELSTPNSNLIRLSDEDGGIYLEDENGNTITIDKKGFKIKSDKNIVIEGKNIKIKGSKVDVN